MAQKSRILCLDGGGIRGLSEILILKELMLQVRMQNGLDSTPEPRQCFDFICGTSTGGLLAVLLGRLGCSLDECEALYRDLGSEIFSGSSLQKFLTGSKHASAGLTKVVQQKAGEQAMYDAESPDNEHVPVAVVAVSRSTRDDYLFRTYGVRASTESCSIVQACLATSAATTFFPSVTINGVEYVDGAFQKNNPSAAAISEVESDEWPSPVQDGVTEIACLVSIGTGQSTFSYKKPGFLSNLMPKGLSSMKEAAKMCVSITMDCHKAHLNVQSRFEKAGRTDVYYRFDVDMGLETLHLDECDERALQHISAVTKSYLQRQAAQLKRCAPLICPKRVANADTAMCTFPGLLCSGTPDATNTFLGRDPELLQLQEVLDPGLPGSKCVLLCGMGGTGKTQLAVQHIQAEKSRYSAIVWINVWTPHHEKMSLHEALCTIESHWPRDLPIPHRGGDGDADVLPRVLSRLRSTRHRNWLLVIDSAENLDQGGLAKYIPSCPHGSVLITSTKRQARCGPRQFEVLNIDGLDSKSSLDLLLTLAQCSNLDDGPEIAAAKEVAKELDGFPLAIEQAAGLIREGEFTFSHFLSQYRSEYRRLMTVNPSDELWSYDKNRVILTILDMAHRSLSSECAILLEYIGVLGSWSIPMSALENSSCADGQLKLDDAPKDVVQLHQILSDRAYLRLSLRRLASFCLIRLKEVSGKIESLTIHRIMCSWSLNNIKSSNREVLLIMAAHGLGHVVLIRSASAVPTVGLSSLLGEIQVERRSVAAFKHCLSVIQSNSSLQGDLDPVTGKFRTPYSRILRIAAWVATALGNGEDARRLFHSAIGFEISRLSQEGQSWPDGVTAFELLCGLSRACTKTGDLRETIEALESALPLAQQLYGSRSHMVLALVSLLKKLSEKQETMLQHHKAAVISSTSTSHDVNTGESSTKLQRNQSHTLPDDPVEPDSLADRVVTAHAFLNNEQAERAADPLENATYAQSEAFPGYHPDLWSPKSELGFAYVNATRNEKAKALVKHITELESENTSYDTGAWLSSLTLVATAYVTNREPKEAVSLLEHVVRIGNKTLPEEYVCQAFTQIELDQAGLVITQAKRAIMLFGDHRAESSRAYWNDVEDVISLLNIVAKLNERIQSEHDPEPLGPHDPRLNAWCRNGQWHDSILELNRATIELAQGMIKSPESAMVMP